MTYVIYYVIFDSQSFQAVFPGLKQHEMIYLKCTYIKYENIVHILP